MQYLYVTVEQRVMLVGDLVVVLLTAIRVLISDMGKISIMCTSVSFQQRWEAWIWSNYTTSEKTVLLCSAFMKYHHSQCCNRTVSPYCNDKDLLVRSLRWRNLEIQTFDKGREVKVWKKFKGNMVNGWRPDHKPGSQNVCSAAQSGERSIFSFEEASSALFCWITNAATFSQDWASYL